MKKNFYKLMIMTLVLTMVLGIFSNVKEVSASTIAYNVKVLTETKETDGSDKLIYWSGEQIMPRGFFDISGDGVDIKNATSRITVPKVKVNGKLVIDKPTFVKLDTAKTWQVSEDDDNWYVTYHFETLTGGSIAIAQFPFKFINEITPDGTKIEVKYELFDGNQVLLDEDRQIYTAKTYAHNSRKVFQGQTSIGSRRSDSDENTVYIARRENYIDQSAPEKTPDTGWQVTYGLQIYSESSNSGQGVFKLDNSPIKLVDYLPVGATLSQTSIDEGWTYDQATHTATWEGIAENYWMELRRYHSVYGYGKRITLDFKEYPIYLNQRSISPVPHSYTFTNKADFYLFPNQSNEVQYPQRQVTAIFEAYETNYTPGSNFAFDLWGSSTLETGGWNNIYVASEHDITENSGKNKSVHFNSKIVRTHSGVVNNSTDFSGGTSYELSKV